jgi:hypothetical protein
MKTSRTTLLLGEKDREAIAVIRQYYGLHSDADAIRMAIRELGISRLQHYKEHNTPADQHQ